MVSRCHQDEEEELSNPHGGRPMLDFPVQFGCCTRVFSFSLAPTSILWCEPHTLWGRRVCNPSPLSPAYKGSSEVTRRIYLVERTSTDAFEVTANPCNHGNFCKGSSETVGIRLSKYSGAGHVSSPRSSPALCAGLPKFGPT